MDLLDFLTDEELIRFLQCNKTEITSYIEKPLTFLNQLRDNKLVPENLYQKVKKMKNKPKGVYEILEWVENKPGQHVRKFWRHLFQNHILREYRRLRGLKKRLLDGTFRISEKLPNAETPSSNTEVERKKKKQEQKKGATKRKKIVEETDEELPGPSSASSQKKQAVKPPLCCVQIAINLPDAETPSSNMTVDRKKKKQEQNKGATKRKKSGKETHEMERGPSSVSNRKKLAMNLKLSKHLKKGELPVICRDKEGTLYKDKLARGEKCILSKGVLYTPGDFERFSGREKSKNWKLSIRCENITLHELIQSREMNRTIDLVLDLAPQAVIISFFHHKKTAISSQMVKPFTFLKQLQDHDLIAEDLYQEVIDARGKERTQKGVYKILNYVENQGGHSIEKFFRCVFEDHMMQKYPFLCSLNTSLLEESIRFLGQLPAAKKLTGSEAKKKKGRNKRKQGVDETEKKEPHTSVSRSSQKKVAMKPGFSPEEFVKQELTLTDGHWKKDILCHGKTLNYLVKKKILYVHSLLCPCHLCCPENRLDQDNDDVCYICNSDLENLVCCNECPRAFHHHCHLPTLQEDTLGDKWMCTFCVIKTNQGLWNEEPGMSMQDALQNPVSGTITQCEYLLLRLYKEDTERVFTDDPTTTVKRYRSVISKPMWLNRVKTKLQNKEYETMAVFVCDIILIFNNCKTFNKDNAFGKMGERLSKTFVQDFYTIFKIQ